MLSILARFGPQQILISICGDDLIHMIIRGNLKSVVNFALAIKNRSGIERQLID